MAATGKTPILLYGSATATNTPSAGNLTNSSDGCEIAINVADKNLFFKDSTNAVNTVPIRQSSASSNGWLSSTDWTTFNNKQTALVSGTNIKTVNGTTLLGSGDLGTIGIGYGGTGITSFGTGVQTALGQNVTGSGGFVLLNSPTFATGGTTSNAAEFYSASTTNGAKLKLSDNRNNFTLKTVPVASSTNLALTYANDTSEFMRWFASGGVSIGNTTDPGAANLSVSGSTTSALFKTATNGPVSATTGTFVTVYTFPNVAQSRLYVVFANIGSVNDSANYGKSAYVITDGTSATIYQKFGGAAMDLQMSGLNLQAVQISGGTQNIYATITRLA